VNLALSRTLRPSDLEDPVIADLMRSITGDTEPRSIHRKAWEFALGVMALEAGGVLNDQAVGLSVAAGHESILYYLANRCSRIFATDLYGDSDFRDQEGSSVMLTDPDVYAPYPYRRGRLHVCWMDAFDLRFEDDAFDFVVSFGSIEHFGQVDGAARALAEMARVVRPGGVVFVTTEQPIDGKRQPNIPACWLFEPEALLALVADVPALELLGETDFLHWPSPGPPVVSGKTFGSVFPAGYDLRSHLGLRVTVEDDQIRSFTSISLALVKRSR